MKKMLQLKHGALCETYYSRLPKFIRKKCVVDKHPNIYLLNFFILGFPLWAIFHYGFFSTFDFEKLGLFLSLGIYIASFWIWLGPLLICRWEQEFSKFVRKIALKPRHVEFYDERFKRQICFYRNYARWFGLFLGVFTLYFFWISWDFLRPYTTLFDRPIVYFFTVLTLFVSGFSCGYGITGVIQALILFHKVKVLQLEWRPFHFDRRGGFAFLGDFALTTVVVFACGTVVLPATLGIAWQIGSELVVAVYYLSVVYAILLATIFGFPMFQVYSLAKRGKEKELEKLSKRLTKLYTVIDRLPDSSFTVKDARILEFFEKFKIVEERVDVASIIPFSRSVILKVIPSALSPIILTVLSATFERWLGLFELLR